MMCGIVMRSLSSSLRRTRSSARSGLPGAYDRIGSFCGLGGVKIPGALMSAILELNVVRAELTRYVVPSWGVGELWVRDGVVLAHDFDFGAVSGEGVDGPEVDDDLVVRLRAFFRGDHVR